MVYAEDWIMTRVIYYPSAKQLWTPAAYPSAMWMDAIDSSALVLSGSSATQFNDRNGNGRYFAQATSTQQPTYDPTGLNGKGVLLYDGNDTMLGVNTDFYASDWCAVVVARHANATTNGTFFSKWNLSGNQRELLFRANFTNFLSMFISTNGINPTQYTATMTIGTSYGVFGAYKNGTNFLISLNGQQSSVFTIPATVFDGSAQYQLGALGGGDYLNGGMQKFVFIPGAYSLAVFQQLEGWAAWDSGLEGSLAAGHPFKSAHPTL